MSGHRRRLRRRQAVAIAVVLPALVLALAAVWTAGGDLERHEQYAATAGLWVAWLLLACCALDAADR